MRITRTFLAIATVAFSYAWLLVLSNLPVLADQIWAQRYDGPGHGDDHAIGDGHLVWEQRYVSPDHGDDIATAIAVDSAGNVVVTGHSVSPTGYTEAYTAMYRAADGHLLWEKHGPAIASINYPTINSSRDADRVTVDGADNVVLAVTASDGSFYTAKYGAVTGTLLWDSHDVVPIHCSICYGLVWVAGLTVDTSRNVIVTGTSYHGDYPGNADFYTAKYDALDGHLIWQQRYDGPNILWDEPSGVAVDSAGNVIVTGSSVDYSIPDYLSASFFYTAKYAASDGSLI